jgi:DNA-binding XRE family transcriptional regulator
MRVRLEEVVGQRIRDVRARNGMGQADLGRALAPLLGRPWSRQAVFAAEKGARDFKIAELVAIARVLRTTVSQLVLPGPDVTGSRQERQAVVFPSGQAITAMELIDAVLSPDVDLDSERGQVLRTGNDLAEHIVEARSRLLQADEAAARSVDVLTALLEQVQGLARSHESPQGKEPR